MFAFVVVVIIVKDLQKVVELRPKNEFNKKKMKSNVMFRYCVLIKNMGSQTDTKVISVIDFFNVVMASNASVSIFCIFY